MSRFMRSSFVLGTVVTAANPAFSYARMAAEFSVSGLMTT